MQAHKKYYAFEDAYKKTPGSTKVFTLVSFYLIAVVSTIFFPIMIQNNLAESSKKFENYNNIITQTHLHSYEIQLFYQRLLRGIALNKNYIKNDM